jgi:hypothetical protein
MQVQNTNRFRPFGRALLVLLCGVSPIRAGSRAEATPAPQTAAPLKPAVGTIKTISTDSLTLAIDGGTELKVQFTPDVKVVRVPPGSKDLKEAVPIQLSDLQPGDRVLVRAKPGSDAASFVAGMIVAMKKADIAEKQQKEREEWQRHGIGGLVSSVDTAQNTITIKTLSAAGSKDIVVHVSNSTILRRYAPGSVNFDEAAVAPITAIQAGDQLRARGTRSADGAEFTADEVVSGSFRNIAGIVTTVNASAGTLTLNDLATKKSVELKISQESQMKKLPDRMAQGIAMRLKGISAGADGAAAPAGQPGTPSTAAAGQSQTPQGQGQGQAAPNGNAAGTGAPGGAGGPGGGQRTGDLQQMLSRLPASPLGDFQKGDAVMVVATSGQGDGPSTVITMLGGVEPILQASSNGQAASILSPWSLGAGGGGDMGNP